MTWAGTFGSVCACGERKQTMGTGKLGQVADPSHFLETIEEEVRRKRIRRVAEKKAGGRSPEVKRMRGREDAMVTRVHGDDEGGVHWDPPEPKPFCRCNK